MDEPIVLDDAFGTQFCQLLGHHFNVPIIYHSAEMDWNVIIIALSLNSRLPTPFKFASSTSSTPWDAFETWGNPSQELNDVIIQSRFSSSFVEGEL
jgi:hypothetical protein